MRLFGSVLTGAGETVGTALMRVCPALHQSQLNRQLPFTVTRVPERVCGQ